MFRKILIPALAATLVTLLVSSRALAFGGCHAEYTHVGPNGVYHVQGTEVHGGGAYGGGAYGGGAYGGGGYHAEYAGGYHTTGGGAAYGGAAAGGYHYSPSYSGGAAGGDVRVGSTYYVPR
jgi:heterogeneous nuclear ribonucleoprotein A1/A3